MLRKIAFALVAASLIASPVLAQTNSTTAPVTTGQPAQSKAVPTVKKHVAHKHAAKKHLARTHKAKKHLAKHQAKKTHVSKVKAVKHHKSAKHIKKPADKTLG